ncbi:MAG TPA: hypothetical protein VFT49_01435 [Candidatus Saccharimonadales bacterium]|nr:hypothetical protein [Candidatus Saccharimonadales bacterium]
MAEDEFTKLFKYITERFDKVDAELEKKADAALVEKVLALIDKIAKQQEINDEERLVMGHQLDRMDRWVHELADKIGYKLSV